MGWENINRRTSESVFRQGTAGTITLVGGSPQACRVVVWRDDPSDLPANTGYPSEVASLIPAVGQLRTRLSVAAAAGVPPNSGDLWLNKRDKIMGAKIVFTNEVGTVERYTVEAVNAYELTLVDVMGRRTVA